jgi:hypothetical protein
MLSNRPIAESLGIWSRTKNFSFLLEGALTVIKQKRVLELLYGMYCFLLHWPSRVVEKAGFNIHQLIPLFKDISIKQKQEIETIKKQVNHLIGEEIGFLANSYVMLPSGFVFGEYANQGARLFIKEYDKLAIEHFYQHDLMVRHIHSVLSSDNIYFFISTGDQKKYLDKWKISNGKLEFVSRILNSFQGGFTACCKVGEKHYFGTDFGERPNYIYCLDDNRKFFLPKPSYTHFFSIMVALDNRYIFCINQSMPHRYLNRSISIFDTFDCSYVYCQAYSLQEFLDLPFLGN